MVADSAKTEPSPKRRDRKDHNEVSGYEGVYACDWQVATVHIARDDKYQTPQHRTIRDAIVTTVPGVYLG